MARIPSRKRQSPPAISDAIVSDESIKLPHGFGLSAIATKEALGVKDDVDSSAHGHASAIGGPTPMYHKFSNSKIEERKFKQPDYWQSIILPFSPITTGKTITGIEGQSESDRPIATLKAFRQYVISYQAVFDKVSSAMESDERFRAREDELEKSVAKINPSILLQPKSDRYSASFESSYIWEALNTAGLQSIDFFLFMAKKYISGVAIVCDEIEREFKHTKFKDRRLSKIIDIIDNSLMPLIKNGPTPCQSETSTMQNKTPIDDGVEVREKQKYENKTSNDIRDQIDKIIKRCGKSLDPILILGETGTGKSYIAKRIATEAKIAGEYVEYDSSSIAPSLAQSELFGHAKGSFSGADRERAGLIRTAAGKTLFLDEIGNFPPDCRAMLLTFMDTGKIKTSGGDTQEAISPLRLICATNKPENELLQEGDAFFHRFKTIIRLAPLRERKKEIPGLVKAFFSTTKKKKSMRLAHAAGKDVMNYDFSWPGNIRELQAAVENAVASFIMTPKKKSLAGQDIINALLEKTANPSIHERTRLKSR